MYTTVQSHGRSCFYRYSFVWVPGCSIRAPLRTIVLVAPASAFLCLVGAGRLLVLYFLFRSMKTCPYHSAHSGRTGVKLPYSGNQLFSGPDPTVRCFIECCQHCTNVRMSSKSSCTYVNASLLCADAFDDRTARSRRISRRCSARTGSWRPTRP